MNTDKQRSDKQRARVEGGIRSTGVPPVPVAQAGRPCYDQTPPARLSVIRVHLCSSVAKCLLCVSVPLWLASSAPALEVGFGETDITPTLGRKPVYMAGFGQNRKATKVHDPLFARAVVLKDGKRKVALVSVDLVGF